MQASLVIAPEVDAALAAGGAVVALESTLVAHGLPYPQNLELARALEDEVRRAGAVPATIAVVGGRYSVGLSPDDLERLAREGDRFRKTGVGDLAAVAARGGDGATTVSATTVLASWAGIRVFATGGIGGVHRAPPGGVSWDVSSDLATLAKEPVAVVSSGAKIILDLERTLEALETLGVPVVGFGTDEFPGFYTRRTGLKVPHRVDTPGEAAALLGERFDALGQGGVLLCNPIPEADALDPADLEREVAAALAQAEAEGVAGKALTPFLLARLHEASGGRTVRANQALALGNSRVAAAVAAAYAEHRATW